MLDDFSRVRKDFEELHYAWLSCRPENEDEEEEKKLAEKDDSYYKEVTTVVQELLEMSDGYEESYQLVESVKPDPDKDKHEVEACCYG